MLKLILIAIGVLMAVLIVVIALQPNEYRVERAAVVSGPPSVVFAQINDLHKFQGWSPWAKTDSNAKIIFEGPASGPGASFAWAGPKTGEGRMTITDSRADEFVQAKLKFIKPFNSTSIVYFTLKPEGRNTKVTWAMTGQNTFATKAFGLFVGMDKIVGGEFERGLTQLDSVAMADATH
jgi:hypothetical protein